MSDRNNSYLRADFEETSHTDKTLFQFEFLGWSISRKYAEKKLKDLHSVYTN